MKFSEKIVRLRKIRGITQDELASAVGVSRQAVYKWECGQSYPEVMKLVEIKTLFGISIDDLLDESYEVAMPERKKRKRIKRSTATAIEREVEAELNASSIEEEEEEITVVEVEATPLIEDSEDVIRESIIEVAEADTVEEAIEEVAVDAITSVEEEAVEEEVVEEAADVETEVFEPEKEEEITEDIISDNEPEKVEKKRGFFSRLFGRK